MQKKYFSSRQDKKRGPFQFAAFLVSIFFFLAGSGSWSCSSDEDNYFQEESLVQTIGLAQIEAYDALEVDYLVENLLLVNGPVGLTDSSHCFTFFNDIPQKLLTIDFTNGCEKLFFNRVRSGKILINYPTTIGDTLSGRKLTFSNFIVGKKKIEGEIDLEYVSGDTLNITTQCRFNNFKVTFPDGTGATYNGVSKRVWGSGEGDVNPNNNSYLITSVADSLGGTTLDGRTFIASIGVPLLLNFYCAIPGHFPGTSGTVIVPELSGFDRRNREVDYGNGTCDDMVTIITWRRSFAISAD